MKHTITQEYLLRYIYNDLSYLEKVFVQDALKHDSELKKQHKQLLKSINLLDSIDLSPRASSINNILSYSQESRMETEMH